MGMFFHNRFTVDHYINPHFTLTPENPYCRFIMMKILVFSGRWNSFSSYSRLDINSKEFVLRIWKDIIEETRISRQGSPWSPNSIFAKHIVDSINEATRSGSSDFLRAMEEAAREDDRLAQLVGIVNRFAFGNNLEIYRQHLLQLFRKPESEIDQVIHDFLSHSDLEELVLQRSDPVDAGAHL